MNFRRSMEKVLTRFSVGGFREDSTPDALPPITLAPQLKMVDAYSPNFSLDGLGLDLSAVGRCPPLFLKFVTGSSRLPPGGFASLRHALTVVRAPLYGDEGEPSAGVREGDESEGDAWVASRARFARRGDANAKTKTKTKTKDPKRFPLPTAATCFNTLRLPEYPSEAILQHRVATALRHGVEGFGFE